MSSPAPRRPAGRGAALLMDIKRKRLEAEARAAAAAAEAVQVEIKDKPVEEPDSSITDVTEGVQDVSLTDDDKAAQSKLGVGKTNVSLRT